MTPAIGQKLKSLCVYKEWTDNTQTVAIYTPALNLGVVVTSKYNDHSETPSIVASSMQVCTCPDEVIRCAIIQHDAQTIQKAVTISLQEELDRR